MGGDGNKHDSKTENKLSHFKLQQIQSSNHIQLDAH